MMKLSSNVLLAAVMLLSTFSTSIFAQDISPLEGRWDLVLFKDGKELPSWLEIRHSGSHTLVGRFVYAIGSARPISEIKVQDGKFSFTIPPQWVQGSDLQFEGEMTGNKLEGTMVWVDGKTSTWTATRAPILAHNDNPEWGKPIDLLDSNDLKGWHILNGVYGGTPSDWAEKNQWFVKEGVLTSPKSGSNLVTDEKFTDFKLHIEFNVPKGSNSGIYLRGRYEVQIMDSYGEEPSDVLFSGVYGFLAPNQMAAKPAGEWQTYDITLIGRRVTIVANGVTVINETNIPGITGGAIDSHEGEPGPLLIQGDHGPIEFRNIIITPMVN